MKNDDSNYKQIFSKIFNEEQKMLQYLERVIQSVKTQEHIHIDSRQPKDEKEN